MASFNPEEWKKTKEDAVFKLPLRKFEPTLRKFTQLVLPTDLDRLKRHQANMEKHLHASAWNELNVEQINAARTVQQLRATVRDLENTRQQIQDNDLEVFDKRVAQVKNDVYEAIQSFCKFEEELGKKIKETAISSQTNEAEMEKFNNTQNEQGTSDSIKDGSFGDIQIQTEARCQNKDAVAVAASWNDLRQSLLDLNGMINEFSNMVSQQQEQIDSISDNVDKTHTNVRQGALQLAQANKYKAAMFPVAGAIVGGLVGGPIGLIAGFKLAGVATAVGGGFVGWQGAKYLKKRRDEHIDVELKKLSVSSSKSDSNKLKNA